MAKKLGASPTTETRGISAEELKRVIKEHKRQADNASEYAGHAGQVIKTAVDKHNLNTKALRQAISNDKAETVKRMDNIRSFIEYSFKLGHFNETDAFDDIVDYMDQIVKAVRSKPEKGTERKADPVVAQVLQ